MSVSNIRSTSKTNWEQVDKLADVEIDTSEIPPLSSTFFKRAKLRTPPKNITVTLNLDPEVLEWFKAQGSNYESRINAALRLYAEAHKVYS